MELSIIIVNYNVKHFLEQCLISVKKALNGIEGEIIVVDNNSVDGSLFLINEKFKDIVLISNEKNTGFSVANNQGIKIARGENILLLNPDTVVQEDTFVKCLEFLDNHQDAGALEEKCMMVMEDFYQNQKEDCLLQVLLFTKYLDFQLFSSI